MNFDRVAASHSFTIFLGFHLGPLAAGLLQRVRQAVSIFRFAKQKYCRNVGAKRLLLRLHGMSKECMKLVIKSAKIVEERTGTFTDKRFHFTHLLRTVIANFVAECILCAKTIPLNLTGAGR